MDSKSPTPVPHPQKPTSKNKDFLTHLEIYLAKRDGVDKLLKISRYAAKIVLASSLLTQQPLLSRLQSFESSVGVSRKAFRLGKFIQDVNVLRSTHFTSHSHLNIALTLLAYGGEGLYFFIEQFVWLGKAGLIDKRHLPRLQKWSAWCEFLGYFGSVGMKVVELRKIDEEERCLVTSIDVAVVRGIGCGEEEDKLGRLREKKMMKRLSVVQDLADALMALADIRDGGGRLSGPMVVSSAGLVSAVISTHKNWVSC
ncbi:hypothetical protein BUALT_Bualt08G0064500 [Buddleja alternifolia]|uniref:Peroxisomal membrane protein 11A n=1 Tax=Buddleja alternifolia TaxID=168488 RepID=A0AAV6X3N3_9LAMI|nr:hypothetical protein BUALT_Bualt08G0064500 [Buddleja alternifolia]